MRSGIIIPFPEAATFDGWRERTCVSKPSHLSLIAHAHEVVLVEEHEPARWRRRATFPLAGVS